MIVNDLNDKVKDKFYKEVTIEDDGEDIAYVFPDTKEFINIIKRKMIIQDFICFDDDE
ncbi:MAG: hypothetical protein GF311_01495 [Candidatus Lokiarchaeota archaeon]|nr:hypothetical protein [Candidatus Lokiarchaeota archaeon]MBD3211252.1 hypothetical protein [Candidatus Lokiarchaeota archaeon]